MDLRVYILPIGEIFEVLGQIDGRDDPPAALRQAPVGVQKHRLVGTYDTRQSPGRRGRVETQNLAGVCFTKCGEYGERVRGECPANRLLIHRDRATRQSRLVVVRLRSKDTYGERSGPNSEGLQSLQKRVVGAQGRSASHVQGLRGRSVHTLRLVRMNAPGPQSGTDLGSSSVHHDGLEPDLAEKRERRRDVVEGADEDLSFNVDDGRLADLATIVLEVLFDLRPAPEIAEEPGNDGSGLEIHGGEDTRCTSVDKRPRRPIASFCRNLTFVDAKDSQTRAARANVVAMTVGRALSVPSLIGALLVVSLASLLIGPSKVGPTELWGLLMGTETDPSVRAIFVDLRLPRLVLGLGVGSALAVSGALMQAVFRNPLAEPGLVGVSSGAALGAATAIVLGGNRIFGALTIPAAASAGALLATVVIQRAARRDGLTSTSTLLLAGLALTSFVNALLGLLLQIANDAELRNLTFWLLGSLGGQSLVPALLGSALMLAAVVWGAQRARALDALLLGEAEAQHLGVNVERLKRNSVAAAAVATGTAVALSGVIGFVGLLVPHLIRLGLGPAHAPLLPRSALLGALLLVGADVVARNAVSPTELPIGVLTALLGAPFFLWLLTTRASES